ncbi:MAG: hypothetical protein DMG54_13055 [Acidobacteria bacterium]|nr:MAG: hypothetical protein DMG54_13055 [Acidobacteriota bacterium]PYU46256.1 MAG: hypothetical protein DMG53_12420 [Acidobacteriota bacterium]PYU54988.1 MAG: hypothetical protein DMG55_29620 [Acidobacteriota bacterium]PYU72582.1 MAG: hypothetical protein DMG52_18340 [Acidobacteriota bacterium]
MTAERSDHGVIFLSMSAGSEVEPGPGWAGQQGSLELVHRLSVETISREAQATARAVGWGGLTGG